MARFTFRVIGPGLDWLAQIDSVEELEGVVSLMELFVAKFKRDAVQEAERLANEPATIRVKPDVLEMLKSK